MQQGMCNCETKLGFVFKIDVSLTLVTFVVPSFWVGIVL